MSNEMLSPVMQANLQMAHVWSLASLESVTFHLKNARGSESFQKVRDQYKGTLAVGPCVFFQFARDPRRDGSRKFVNINIDDIVKFIVKLQKSSSPASSPAVQESS